MLHRRLVRIACAVVVAALLGAASAQAWSSLTRTNHLTFTGAVALPGVVLAPGSYTFESGPVDFDPNLVRVMSRDGRRLLYQGFTAPVSRPRNVTGPVVMFGEAPAGQARPIAEWYPVGRSDGHKFVY